MTAPLTARARGLVGCAACSALSPLSATRCSHCKLPVRSRKPDSLARTWALLIAAAALYIPANIYPVMTVTYFGDGEPDTIMSGVLVLLEAGQTPIALLVFFASIVVPMVKLLALSYLTASVQRRSRWNPRLRTRLYRFVETIGRWSMLDIFMISILVALVQLGSLASVDAGVGATAFAAVVVLTMFAARSFDPRLIWDVAVAGRSDV